MHRRHIIGVIEPDLVGSFTAAIMDGIHNVAQQSDVEVMVFKGSPASVGGRMLAQDHVGGWILCDCAPEIHYLGHPERPIVAISMAGCADVIPTIMPDNLGGIKTVMQHLFDHGHKRIAFIGPMKNADVQQRYRSYRAALEQRGAFDARLVVDTAGHFEEHGRAAVQVLLETELNFTAVVTAGDFNAFGAVEVLRSAGLRVPEDVAVTGFDDVPSAQFADPPLTTVYQRPEALGELAAQTLLAMIEGETVPPGEKFAPTALIRRRSCGCDTTQALPLPNLSSLQEAGWKDFVVKHLVMLARHPLPVDPQVPPDQAWPGAVWLADQLGQILQGGPAPSTKFIQQAWREAVALTAKLDILYAMVKLLESAAREQLARQPESESVRLQVNTFIDRNRLAMMRAQLYRQEIVTDELDQLQRTYAAIDAALLGDEPLDQESFDWMIQTPADWACLGLWEGTPESAEPTLRIAGIYQRQLQVDVRLGSLFHASAFPPAELIDIASTMDQPSNVVLLPVDTTAAVRPFTETRPLGVLALRLPTAKQIIYDLHGLKLLASRLASKLERMELLQSLHEKQERLIHANASLEEARTLAEEANDFKSKFVANMSHELRTPLNAILNFTRFMMDPELGGASNEQQAMFQRRVLANADHLLGLINDILDLAKIEAGRMELLPEPTDLSILLKGVMSTAAGLTRDKDLELELDMPADLPKVWIDKTRIRQVLLNMLSNAAKFTSEGGITLRAHPVEPGFIQVSVTDTGVGIPIEKQHLVFEEFRQIDTELAREHKGTGLGMPISKRFIELHGGRMWFESTPGVGSTFSFTVPLYAPEVSPAPA